MSGPDVQSSIADSSKPNSGRIYDYLLGGHHNFEIDRQAAQQVIKAAPFTPQLARLVRWFLGEAVQRLCEQEDTNYIDFASGLPTVDHIHQVSPKGTKVLYSDLDPVTVAYATDIIKDHPNTRYVQCDIREPQVLLNSPTCQELFGNQKKMCFGFNGIAYFLMDEELEKSLREIYNWCDEGSRIFLTDFDADQITPELQRVLDLYKSFGVKGEIRPISKLKSLTKPWKEVEPGFQLLEDWVDIETKVTEDVMKTWTGGGIKGAILEK